jgi:hypothetical protein
MAKVVIDRFKALPPVCIMTGETEDVIFERTKLKSNDEVQVLKLLVMSLVTAPLGTHWRPRRNTETFELSLPFTRAGLAAYRRGRSLLKACLGGAILCLVGMIAVMAFALGPHPSYLAMLGVLGGGLVGVGTFFLIAFKTRGSVPRVLSFDERRIGLDLPSAVAAKAVQRAITEKRAARDEALAKKRARKNRPAERAAAEEPEKSRLQPLSVSKRRRRPR